ncbi:tRNA(fMet)-specific endonuclease VapC [Catalinimonas alkaloidigena]|uniref:tRNA(fMet)-specific endonuclease VapC n=1 Tax=Catalinimonas alkaloidigena TaxID=1075417 RepID=A0A1G9AK30_9BACT|nr:PIN domain-containing protein [Catalinimonas alkaloidigena]SDK27628.1 tRNA(fMet)-specific endonuclease VapC [Catalinimonas alkaloidigena]
MDVFLDTNILIYAVRNEATFPKLKTLLGSKRLAYSCSVINYAELKAMGLKLSWQQKKLEQIEEVMQDVVIVDIRFDAILNRYAEIDAYSLNQLPGVDRKKATPMGQNDMWIAATASVLEIPLLTTDKDFDHLHNLYLDVIRLEPKAFK